MVLRRQEQHRVTEFHSWDFFALGSAIYFIFVVEAGLLETVGSISLHFFAHVIGYLPVEVAVLIRGVHVSAIREFLLVSKRRETVT